MTVGLDSRYSGCLIGAAVGDPRGAAPQLMLFTADGLLRAHNRILGFDASVDVVGVVHRAYLRWLETQRLTAPPPRADGWLAGRAAMYRRHEVSPITLQALRSGLVGHLERPINNSRGASVVARVLPVALACWEPFGLGAQLAAVTHGHPTAILAAAAYVQLLQGVVLGASISAAAEGVYPLLEAHSHGGPCLRVLDAALDAGDLGDPTAERIERFGPGETALSAVSIGVYCAAATDEFAEGVRVAARAAGPRAAPAVLAGALLGARCGAEAVTGVRSLELRDELLQVASDLSRHFAVEPFEPSEADWKRYPG